MVPCREGDGEKPHPSAPFRQHWIQSASTGLLSGRYRLLSWKVPIKALFHLHLLDFVMNRLISEALPTNFVRVALPSPCRNGSKSRDSEPLWKWLFRSTPAVGLLDGTALPSSCRNGSKFRDSVPLRYSIKMSKILTIFKKLDTLCVNNRQLGNFENQLDRRESTSYVKGMIIVVSCGVLIF